MTVGEDYRLSQAELRVGGWRGECMGRRVLNGASGSVGAGGGGADQVPAGSVRQIHGECGRQGGSGAMGGRDAVPGIPSEKEQRALQEGWRGEQIDPTRAARFPLACSQQGRSWIARRASEYPPLGGWRLAVASERAWCCGWRVLGDGGVGRLVRWEGEGQLRVGRRGLRKRARGGRVESSGRRGRERGRGWKGGVGGSDAGSTPGASGRRCEATVKAGRVVASSAGCVR